VFSLVQNSVSERRIIFFIAEAFICLGVTHFFRYFLIKFGWLNLPVPKMLPRLILSISALGFFIYFIRVPVSIALDVVSVQRLAFETTQILGFGSFYVFLLFLWSIFYFTYHYIERYNKSLKYEASMIEIELNNLKSQLNPHFIFNALNSIRALIDENPKKSKLAINQLSNILRNSLAYDKAGLTSFDDELKIVKDYLGLETIRFEERLKTDFDIDPRSSSFMVPSFMIQTLVENGIKHGISKLKQGGSIQVKTHIENDRLKIQIRNSGQLAPGSKKGNKQGLGLRNTQQRLRLLFGDKATFRIANENHFFVLTEITIPHIS
jgi:two-component system, LytTR family, sensor kinase